MRGKSTQTAYILHCVEDAKYLIKQKHDHRFDHIFTTHHSVNDYLKYQKIESTDLSKYVADESMKTYFERADYCINEALIHMDALFSNKISIILDVDLKKYFSPLYVYPLKYEYAGYSIFIDILNVIIKNGFVKVVFFDSLNLSFYTKNKFFLTYVEHYLNDYNCLCEIVSLDLDEKKPSLQEFIQQVALNPGRVIPKVKEYILGRRKQKIKNDCIVLLENLYDLEFLKNELDKNIVVWPITGAPNFKDSKRISNEQKIEIRNLTRSISATDITKKEDPILEILIKIILNDFNENIESYLNPILTAQLLIQRSKVNAVIWGNPPVNGSKSLVNELFLEKKIPIIGMQHGAGYGIQKSHSFHFNSDFERCTDYLSYGFDERDLRLTYPDRKAECKILPVGTTKRKVNSKKRKSIDILFPITNCISLLSACRTNAYWLAMCQGEIINKLELLKGVKSFIKPMPGFSDRNFAFCERIKNISHSKISSLPLNIFLRKYLPKMIIFEFISTPLYEIVDEDVEILALNDQLFPFNEEAFHLLKKRVYVFDTIDELIIGIDLWCAGRLPKLRNDEFYHKYIYKKDSKRIIISHIDRIIESGKVSGVIAKDNIQLFSL